jgi:N-acetylmuramoyl-L-alanine amidase CwlA
MEGDAFVARFNVTYSGPPNGYGNRGMIKRYIAIHNTSNDASPAAEASYAKRRPDKVSSHFYADAKTVIQSLDTKYDANHAGSREGNGGAISFELVGTNSSSVAHWKAVIDEVAPVMAAVMKAHKIANRHLTVAQMRAGSLSGIVTHDDMRRAWGSTSHTDPGKNFPMDYLLRKLAEHLDDKPSTPKPGTPAKPSVPAKLTVDGKLNAATIKRWQQVMGTPVDGKISSPSELVKAVQRLLKSKINSKLVVDGKGIEQDGRVYETVKALQKYLGTPVDGKLSSPASEAVKALQRRLNEGRF